MLKIHQKKRQPGYPKVSSFHRKPFSGASLLWWQSSLRGISISSIFKRTILTSLSNLKFSPPMQIMAKHKFNPGQIFKPFCCAGFFGGCLLGLVWGIFCGGGLLCFFLCTSYELPERLFRAENHAPYSKSCALELQMQLLHSDPWKWEKLDRKISVKTNSEWVIFTGKQ